LHGPPRPVRPTCHHGGPGPRSHAPGPGGWRSPDRWMVVPARWMWVVIKTMFSRGCWFAAEAVESGRSCTGGQTRRSPMPIGRHSKARTADQQGLTRRRFLRAAGVGTAGAMAAAGAVMGQAGAEVAGAAVPAAAQRIPARRKVVRASGQQTAAAPAAALAVSGPLSFHTIAPQRYLDTRFDGGGPFPRRAASASSSSSTSGIPTTSPPASRTRYLPRRRRSPATSPSPAGPRAGTSAPSRVTAT